MTQPLNQTPTAVVSQQCQGITKTKEKCKNTVKNNTKFCRFHTIKYDKPDECPICMESLFQVVKPLQCGHWVHKSCIKKFVHSQQELKFSEGYSPMVNAECPVCRAKLTDIKTENPVFQIYLSKAILLNSINNFLYNKVPLAFYYTHYLINHFSIKDEEMLMIVCELSHLISSIISSQINSKEIKEYFGITADQVDENVNQELGLEAYPVGMLHHILTAENGELVLSYQL